MVPKNKQQTTAPPSDRSMARTKAKHDTHPDPKGAKPKVKGKAKSKGNGNDDAIIELPPGDKDKYSKQWERQGFSRSKESSDASGAAAAAVISSVASSADPSMTPSLPSSSSASKPDVKESNADGKTATTSSKTNPKD